MSLKPAHVMSAFVIFSILISLMLQGYNGVVDVYDITPTDLQGGQNIMEKLEGINIISGMKDIVLGLQTITNPTSSGSDIVGGLMASGLGWLKIFTGILTFPIQILGIISGFYTIPPIFELGIGLIMTIYISVIAFNKQTGGQ